MSSDRDGEILAKAYEVDDYFGSFFRDALDDWTLAEDLGELFLRIGEARMGHALLARAQRHLGNIAQAGEHLERCKTRVADEDLTNQELEMFDRFLAEEDLVLKSLKSKSK